MVTGVGWKLTRASSHVSDTVAGAETSACTRRTVMVAVLPSPTALTRLLSVR